ncbi:CDC5 cell division cycle 5-like protein [Cichlidogyrus casuarinus]|uniref:CDC5 cell division cycle 5-like protein n=1 Tax=Cichlidogyrus casuarinus TaxID=1844966 RepID=A0ABD2Q8A3_9PLAT
MGRINIKGGLWRNTEDEILKAAVMKYGKNQWARIASLLHRKSAKQCKARWYEWLDPSVKKTEWSREEDEKLLHLAKLMPTQWRTIAPIVGRTANQCLERYEYLLDKAQNLDSTSREEHRRLRPGEIDPTPETKPARPDPIDMDEDELEMLSEARARLANTQGKKAKRKARERQLEIARRMALMQKRRELRAAGLGSKLSILGNPSMRLKNEGLDYNREIPFEKKPLRGFYDTSGETTESKKVDFDKLRLTDVEKESYMEREKRERKKDAERQAKRLENDLPNALKNRSGLDEGPAQKRSKLVLPAPQISDSELENLIKVGQANENALRLASMEENELSATATAALLSEYNESVNMSNIVQRTPLLPQDSLLQEAQNLMALQNTQTPLKGGENAPIPDSAIQCGLKPVATPTATPNVALASQILGFKTPDVHKLESGTPLSVFGSTPTFQQSKSSKQVLRFGLDTLPKPKNNFEINVPGEDDMTEEDQETKALSEEDQAEIDRRRNEQAEEAEKIAWAKRSLSLQRALPRPCDVNQSVLRPQDPSFTDLQKAEELIKQELVTMLHYDAASHPPTQFLADLQKPKEGKVLGPQAIQKRVQAAKQAHESYLRSHQYANFEDTELEHAKMLVKEEMEVVKQGMGHGDLTPEAYNKVWEECRSQVLYLPVHRRFTRASLASKRDRIESAEKQMSQYRDLMTQEAKRATKLEKRLQVLLGGYQSRAQILMKAIQESVDQTEQSEIEYQTLSRLREQEIGAVQHRLDSLQMDVQRQVSRETELQARYAKLVEMKETQA